MYDSYELWNVHASLVSGTPGLSMQYILNNIDNVDDKYKIWTAHKNCSCKLQYNKALLVMFSLTKGS